MELVQYEAEQARLDKLDDKQVGRSKLIGGLHVVTDENRLALAPCSMLLLHIP